MTREEWRKQHYAANREKYKQRVYAWRRNNPVKQMLIKARSRAKKLGVPFSLVETDVTIPEFCPVLNLKLSHIGAGRQTSPSLDRIDNRGGYTRDNVMVVSWRANNLKSDATPQELKLLANFYGETNVNIE